jgi:NitT/TauT family transport system substrate-binding protein
MKTWCLRYCLVLAILMQAGAHDATPAQDKPAQDKLVLAVGQRGGWDTAVAEIGARAGIFRTHGLELDILYTQGSGETQQAVIAGSASIGVAVGVMGVLGVYAKGAPVRVIGAEQTGLPDMYFYVPAASAIRTLADAAGKTIAYSTNGSSTHSVVTALIKQHGLSAKPVATGGPAATLTQVMSGQTDVGWSAPPFGLAQLARGEIRTVARGSDAVALRDQTVRFLITSPQMLATQAGAIARFMTAYRASIDFMYDGDEALRIFAGFAGIDLAIARRTRDEFFPKAALDPDTIVGLPAVMADAVVFKYLSAPLSSEQLGELIRLQAR